MKNLPDIEVIKQLENSSQKKGSGIVYEELLGIWKFQYVWKKGSDEIDNISSSLLQVLSAKLELRKFSKEDSLNFEIINSINFGLISVVFSGKAFLTGNRPILPFYFENVKFNIVNFPIIYKQLKKTNKKNMPFFSMIGISRQDNWMCARGRGGGLAIWIKT